MEKTAGAVVVESAIMSRLQSRVFYGLRTDVSGNAHFVSDDEVLYLVGNALAVHNFSQRRQRLVRLPDKHKINLMSIAPNKKHAALCEVGEKALISIYELSSMKRKKLLGIPYDFAGASGFSCLGFSFDSKYLAAVTDEGQTMLYYNWEKGKVESSLELSSSQSPAARVHLLASNPSDSGILAVAGRHVFKFLTASETVWRPYGFSKADNLLVTSIGWLNGDRLLAGLSDARLLFLENGELKNVFRPAEVPLLNLKLREEVALQPSPGSEDRDVLCLTCFQRGFALALDRGPLLVFEKDGQHKYVRRHLFELPEQPSGQDSLPQLYRVNAISSNPSSDKLLVTCGWSQLFCAALWAVEARDEPRALEVLGHDLHHGPIGGLSSCTWKSHVATYGELDRTVRLWDYHNESLIMIKQYLERISCVVLHPTGLLCLIGFSDKLRLMSILIDDFLAIKEFPIRSCRIAAFSFGGHLFAAVNGNIIQVYSIMDFNIRFLLKGHTEIISGITWSHDDRKLVSIGTEGAIYEWDMSSGSRVKEIVLKGVTLKGVVLSADGITTYCISSDGFIHEIKENTVIRAYNVPGVEPCSIVMGKYDSLIFITYPNGYVASLKQPLQNPVEFHDYHIHCTDITQMCLTYDEQVLITTGTDGSMCFWKVLYTDGRTSTMSRDLLYLDQILISRRDLGNKVQSIRDLSTRIKELETEHAYKMRQTSIQHNETMREIHQSYCEAIEELRDKIDKLEDDQTNEINTINVEIARSNAAHDEAMRQMEISYDAKLIFEYDKYNKFEEYSNGMREDYENKLAELTKQSKQQIEETIAKYENRLKEKELQLKEAHEEIAQEVRVHEMIKEQIEDDADREIIELRTNYETLLNHERELVLKFKGEAGVLRNKYAISQKDLEELKWQLNGLRDDYAQLKARKEELDDNVVDLKTEIAEKESTIISKDKAIQDLELSNQELEKIRFVLDHRVKEMLNQIEPRDREISELKGKIADMETELLALNNINQNLKLKIVGLQEKLSATKREIQNESSQRKRNQQLLRRIRIDLLNAAALIQEPIALKSAVIKLYNRYSASDQLKRSYQADLDAQCEFAKQRDHLEKTIFSLKKQLAHSSAINDAPYDKLLDDNIFLLTELNALRQELGFSQRHITDMETLLGLKSGNIGPTEARNKVAKIVHGNEDLKREYESKLKDCEQIIDVLKDNISDLYSKLLKYETEEPALLE